MLLIDAAGGIPNPFESDMQWRRFNHHDLLDLHDDELEGERVMIGVARSAIIRNRFLTCDHELAWLNGRLAAVLGEQGRRTRTRR
jgi:hypothetical protein